MGTGAMYMYMCSQVFSNLKIVHFEKKYWVMLDSGPYIGQIECWIVPTVHVVRVYIVILLGIEMVTFVQTLIAMVENKVNLVLFGATVLGTIAYIKSASIFWV